MGRLFEIYRVSVKQGKDFISTNNGCLHETSKAFGDRSKTVQTLRFVAFHDQSRVE